ncbi:MAG: protein kinase [Gemmataceae bacterium]|nr:protein kinase [Gemmataceae bacterium]
MSWIREPNEEPIPGYRLIEPLGSGGFGEVWKCEAPGGLFKAIKFVYGNLNSLDVDCVRAEQEQKALNRIKDIRHPFVCSLDLIMVIDGELVIVMELAERTLHDLFTECQTAGLIGIPRSDLLRYLGDAAEALDFMNNEPYKLQHLDVKPKNLFLISNHVKVADFGLVKHLERQSSSGLMGGVTPLYAAPETFIGKISQHSDQYSLAIVYQELMTGHRPYNGKNVRQLAQQHMQEEPDLRSLPEVERPILARALHKDPNKRFPSCMSFISALYKARQPAHVGVQVLEEALVGAGTARKVETLREIQFEEYDEPKKNGVDLAASPPPKSDEDEHSVLGEMGVTVAQPDTGALRPTLIIGLGALGRKALLELRCRFIDRFGDLNKLPLLRFLCVDTDPEAVNVAIRGAPEVALTRNEFYPLPLQPVGNYRRRSLEELSEWLPREKLYVMPRSLQTQGSRALGRLAFADNQQRLIARLRRDIQEITHPDTIYQSVSQTGLALRDTTPRIYLVAAASGGSSGMLADLGFAIKRLLAQLRHPDSPVRAMLFCGATTDPATPKHEQANVYATLTELNHFSDTTVRFAAQYGVDGQRIVDDGMPYSSVYLLTMAHRSPDALEESVAHLGNYLFHELTTPLGLRLDHLRRHDDFSGTAPPPGLLAAPYRSFGTYAVWFPRGLLLRMASRQACRRLIEGWLAASIDDVTNELQDEIHQVLARVTQHPELASGALAARIDNLTQAGLPTDAGNTPGEVLAGLLAKVEEQIQQPVAQEDPGNWAKQALTRLRDWIGSGEEDQEINEWRKTKLTRALGAAVQKIAEEWDLRICQDVFKLMEHPGARVIGAEVAIEEVRVQFQRAAENQKAPVAAQAARTAEAWREVEMSLYECLNGGTGFRLFGGRSRTRTLRNFMDAMASFARHRLAEELLGAVRHFYAVLSARMAERGRDLGFVRQRLRHLQENLEAGPADPEEDLATTRPGAEYTLTHSPIPSAESFWETIRQSATARVILPENEADLERAALRFLKGLHREHWVALDRELHERVLLPRGGLNGACMNSGDLTRQLTLPLLQEAGTVLSQHLPIMDVAQILCSEAGQDVAQSSSGSSASEELIQQVRDYQAQSKPLVQGNIDKKHAAFLLVPASPAGKNLENAIHQVFPDVRYVRVAGQSDLMLCREQGCLTAQDLHKWLKPCRSAYDHLASVPGTSPHSRFDIVDWLPLDP